MGRGRKKEFDREAALEAALGVFWELGFDGASMPALVGRMGIGRQSLYDTFGDKRALYLAALRRYATTRIGAVAGQLRAPGSAYGNLRRVLFRWIEMASNPDGHGCLVGNSLAALPEGDDDAGDILEAALSELERAFVETVRRARIMGEIRPTVPDDELAALLMTTGQGLAVVCRARADRARAVRVVRSALRALAPVDGAIFPD